VRRFTALRDYPRSDGRLYFDCHRQPAAILFPLSFQCVASQCPRQRDFAVDCHRLSRSDEGIPGSGGPAPPSRNLFLRTRINRDNSDKYYGDFSQISAGAKSPENISPSPQVNPLE
jgi:hypothetical protein